MTLGHQLGIRQAEVPTARLHVQQHLEVRVRRQFKGQSAAATVAMAVAAVHMQIGSRTVFDAGLHVRRWCVLGHPLHGLRIVGRVVLAVALHTLQQSAVAQVQQLVLAVHVQVDVLGVESQRGLGPRGVARQALCPAGEAPQQFALATDHSRIIHGDALLRAVGIHQVGFGFVVAPGKGIGLPVSPVVMQQLRFQPFGFATRGSDRQRAAQHRVLGEVVLVGQPVDGAAELLAALDVEDHAIARHGQEPLGRGTVAPQAHVHFKRAHACGQGVVLQLGEQAGATQGPREGLGVVGGLVVLRQRVQQTGVVVHEVQFAVVVLTEGHHPHRRVDDVHKLRHAALHDGGRPHPLGHVVAEDVLADKLRKLLATIDVPSVHAAGLCMVEFDHWWGNGWRRAGIKLAVGGLAGFHQAPTVVAALLGQVNHLPLFPADIAHPQVTGHAVEAEAPGIAIAVAPDFRAYHFAVVLGVDERVVRRDRVLQPVSRLVHIDAQDRRQ